mgnify:CR=1 FL=1
MAGNVVPPAPVETLGTVAEHYGVSVTEAAQALPLAPGTHWPGHTGPGVPLQPAKARTQLAPLTSDEAQALVDQLVYALLELGLFHHSSARWSASVRP